MVLRADIRIPLHKEEVALQMRQSFRLDDVNKWLTSFPMAISRDCHAIIILRTLFVLQPATSSSTASCRSATIPLDFTERLRSYWSDELKPFASDQSHSNHDWYTYSMTFSPTGQHILFSDRNRSGYTNACGVHVGVFSIKDTEGQLSVELVGIRRLRTLLAMSIDHLLFHPKNDIVIVCFGGNIVMWRFKDGKHRLVTFQRLDSLLTLCQHCRNSKFYDRKSSTTWLGRAAKTGIMPSFQPAGDLWS